jgi:3-oxoacyl-[acyl-carrier-protein] synthase-3
VTLATASPASLRLVGLGQALPETILTSAELESRLGLGAGWIERRSGIRARRVLSDREQLETFALSAASAALGSSSPATIDALLVCGSAPETPMPTLASRLAAGLGADPCLAIDLGASSAGFVHGLAVAEGLLAGRRARRVLLVAAEALSRRVDWNDRETCVLFGDGAAAALLEGGSVAEGGSPGLRSGGASLEDLVWGSDGAGLDALSIAPVSVGAATPPLAMRGRRVFLAGVRRMAEALQTLAERAEISVGDLDWVVPHQANARLLEALAQRLGLPGERVVDTISRYGNVGAASLPLALGQAARAGRLVPGQQIALVAFGAGFVWAAARLRWGEIGS